MANPLLRLLNKLFKKGKVKPKGNISKSKNISKVKTKKGIDPKTGYRYGYKPHYLNKEENIMLGVVGGGGPAALIAKAISDIKKEKKNKSKGGPVGSNGIL